MGLKKLVFKGDKTATKKRKASKHPNESTAVLDRTSRDTNDAVELPRRAETEVEIDATSSPVVATTPQIRVGLGQITTSQTVVTGHDTHFTKQVRTGDALVVRINHRDEMRVITMCLSDTSLNLSSAFSHNLSQPTSFSYVNQPAKRDARAKQLAAAIEGKEQEERAAGTFGSTKELVYRERTEHGSYRIKKQAITGEVSRAELLELRAKKTSDKYC